MSSSLKMDSQFLRQLSELYESSTNKDLLPAPTNIEGSAFFLMLSQLQKICDFLSKKDDNANVLFLQYYSVCLRGTNPFKDGTLKKVGIKPSEWRRLLKHLSGDF